MIKTIFAQETAEAAYRQWEQVADALREEFPKLAGRMEASRDTCSLTRPLPKITGRRLGLPTRWRREQGDQAQGRCYRCQPARMVLGRAGARARHRETLERTEASRMRNCDIEYLGHTTMEIAWSRKDFSMSVSAEVYQQATTWLDGLEPKQVLEVYIDLPEYGWVEITDICTSDSFTVAKVRHRHGVFDGGIGEVGFDMSALKAVRKTPNR
ncbi:hypothetical protein WBP07_01315 [Novosphingobium sp. BL-8A]|uniref:hypothetical protein n=1 Tax=Novosphingobium sp. BL-8A TaxID=3127639 RepID=UPI003756DE62